VVCNYSGPVVSDPSRVVVITATWDVADLMGDWLEHHRDMGVEAVVVMDYGSTDGTLELLLDTRWSGFLHWFPFTGLGSDSNLQQLEHARTIWSDGWALIIDPDEFLVTPSWSVSDLVGAAVATGADAVALPRFHMEGPRSLVRAPGAAPGPRELSLRWGPQDQTKVIVNLASAAHANLPGHVAVGERVAELSGLDVCLLHYPTRSFAGFVGKVDHAEQTLQFLGGSADAGFAHHWRRWVAIRNAGGLWEEYLDQFVPDDELDEVIECGEYAWDRRLADRLGSLGGP